MKSPYVHQADHGQGALAMGGRRVARWDWLWKKNHTCPWWLAYTFDHRLRNRLHPPRKIVGPFLEEGMTALDLGCGMGFFSLAMARLVGRAGRVLSVDVQPEMLAKTAARAEDAGLSGTIATHLLKDDYLNLPQEVDFALAFWMAHEVRDLPLLLGRIHHHLKPGGRFLLVEPVIHVSKKRFGLESMLAMETGLRLEREPRIRLSRAAVFQKG